MIVGHDPAKVYRRGREEIRALKNVDFRVDAGEFVTIIGPYGSGKTALLNIIGFVFPQFHLMPHTDRQGEYRAAIALQP
jgi:ABC-type lipoprotein export system ATPase subunit